jgi:hypothetical protein
VLGHRHLWAAGRRHQDEQLVPGRSQGPGLTPTTPLGYKRQREACRRVACTGDCSVSINSSVRSRSSRLLVSPADRPHVPGGERHCRMVSHSNGDSCISPHGGVFWTKCPHSGGRTSGGPPRLSRVACGDGDRGPPHLPKTNGTFR